MAKKSFTYRCQRDEGYTFEEAKQIKARVEARNKRTQGQHAKYSPEIVSDPRGGWMVRCKQK